MKKKKTRPAASQELRARIIDAAKELFVNYGFSRIKMDDLAEKLSISKKTLYRHFPSKEALFEKALLTTLDGWKEHYAGIVGDRSRNCVSKLKELNEFISRCYAMMSRPMAEDLQRFAPRTWKAIEDWRRGVIFNQLAALLDEGVEKGLFVRDMDRQLGLILYYEFASSVLSPDFITKYPYSAAQVSDAVTRLFFGRLLTPKGMAVLKGKA